MTGAGRASPAEALGSEGRARARATGQLDDDGARREQEGVSHHQPEHGVRDHGLVVGEPDEGPGSSPPMFHLKKPEVEAVHDRPEGEHGQEQEVWAPRRPGTSGPRAALARDAPCLGSAGGVVRRSGSTRDPHCPLLRSTDGFGPPESRLRPAPKPSRGIVPRTLREAPLLAKPLPCRTDDSAPTAPSSRRVCPESAVRLLFGWKMPRSASEIRLRRPVGAQFNQ